MSIQHLISIDREAKISIDTGRLKIAFTQAGETHLIAACDIAVLILSHPCITMSLAVYQELSKNGAVIVSAGEKYMPCAISLPVAANIEGAKRPFLQSKYLSTETAEKWWSQLIESKIYGQSCSAAFFDDDLSSRLKIIAGHVELGDKTGREAQAAHIYWPAFFKSLNANVDFRDKQGATDPVNVSLNYGYAVLRAIIARGLVGAGLCLNFGVGHHRKDNPFNLGDDFIEPFRFLVDKIVWNIFYQKNISAFDRDIKKQILSSLLSSTVSIAGKEYRLFHGVDWAINSYCISLEDPRRKLLLPNIPSRPGKSSTVTLWQTRQFIDETQ